MCVCDLTYRYKQGKYRCNKAKRNSVFSGKHPNVIIIYVTKALIQDVYTL